MARYRLVASSSDIVVESEAADLGGALVGLAQAFADITTAGSKIEPKDHRTLQVEAQGDLPRLAVAFIQELIFTFDTSGFLPADGSIEVAKTSGGHLASGTLHGEAFDRGRHGFGTEVKAATLHDAVLVKDASSARARVLLDL